MLDFFERVAALRREGKPFAVATVVARRPPVSAHLGDRAIVFPDGRMEGFVGGACSREIVRREALASMASRQGRLVSIAPDAGEAQSSLEHVVVAMTCASEGAVDVFVEPFLKPRTLIVVGATPVAAAVALLGRAMDYEVVRVVEARERGDAASEGDDMRVVALDGLQAALEAGGPDSAVVVASQGHYDEDALEIVLARPAGYVGLVASRKRGATVRATLEQSGTPNLSALRSPAGLDLGGRTSTEIAVSILAEIVQLAPRPTEGAEAARETASDIAVDPVCGMEVTIVTARYTAEVNGTRYYFCAASCRAAFVKDPQSFLSQQAH
jgi:xanthine dehydrogenase accessory factor